MALAAGLLFGTSAALARTSSGFAEAPTDLPGLIEQRTSQVERLANRAQELRTEVEQTERDSGTSLTASVLSAHADVLAPVIGAGPVAGPALRVTLNDAGYTLDTLPEGYTVDDVVVHQQDVQGVVNALWAGGAEAMMVQDQRIVSTSAIRCVGNTLYLQGRVYSPPYVITAIGDPGDLATALAEDDIVATYRSWSEVLGLGYLVETPGTVQMPGFAAAVRPKHAVVIEEPEPEQAPAPGDGVGPDTDTLDH